MVTVTSDARVGVVVADVVADVGVDVVDVAGGGVDGSLGEGDVLVGDAE